MDGGILSHTLTITPKILKQIAEIDEFKGAWALYLRRQRRTTLPC